MSRAYPVVKRLPSKPSQKFRKWVAQFTPTRLARSLGVKRSSVHSWVTLTGKRRRPRIETALDIVALSEIEPLRGRTKLRITDILGDVEVCSVEIHQAPGYRLEKP